MPDKNPFDQPELDGMPPAEPNFVIAGKQELTTDQFDKLDLHPGDKVTATVHIVIKKAGDEQYAETGYRHFATGQVVSITNIRRGSST